MMSTSDFQRLLLLAIINLLASVSLFSKAQELPVPTVNFCDLTVHPERYAGKLVRVRASFVSWWESSYLYNVECETGDKKIHDGLDSSGDEQCKRLGKKVYGYINLRQRADSHNYAYRAYVTIVGRLIGPSEEGFGHLNGFKFEFRITRVEYASPMARRIPSE